MTNDLFTSLSTHFVSKNCNLPQQAGQLIKFSYIQMNSTFFCINFKFI